MRPRVKRQEVDVSGITWADILKKLAYDIQTGSFTQIAHHIESDDVLNENDEIVLTKNAPPTIICEGHKSPFVFNKIITAMKKLGMKEYHTYISFCDNAPTFGRHNDDSDVIIVPVIGTVSYDVEGLGLGYVDLDPGDLLYIPKYCYHTPRVYGPRATLSFS